MPAIWASLGKGALQHLIGATTIDRLESLLPGLVNSFDSNTLYEKGGLVSVFDAFYGADALDNSAFRLQLFNALSPDTIDKLAKAAEIDIELPFEKKVQGLCAIGWRNRAFAINAAKILGLPPEYVPEERVKLNSDELISPISPKYKPLKDYQFPVANDATEKLKIPFNRFVIQMPTGSGKTRTAIEVISNFLNDAPDGTVVIWLAHSEELCQQAADGFIEIWPHVANGPLRLLRCWGTTGPFPYEFPESAFLVAGFAKLYGLLKREKVRFDALRPRVGLIVVDEAHKVRAPTYEAVTRALIGKVTRVVGLTATPGRSASDHEENEALAGFFFNQLITIDSHGTTSVISYLRRRGVLSHVEYEPLRTHLKYTLSKNDKLHFERFFDLPPGFLFKLGEDDIRNVEIVKKIEKEAKAGRRILFFACSVEHSKFVCALLRFLGITADHIDGETAPEQRASALAKFKGGSLSVLCNFGVLSTGFDAPKTDLIFIARPTSSIVLYSQMIGRGLRGPAIGGTEKCKIIDVIDNIAGFSDQNKVYSFFNDYFDQSAEK
jgi:DNA repair protein RadD